MRNEKLGIRNIKKEQNKNVLLCSLLIVLCYLILACDNAVDTPETQVENGYGKISIVFAGEGVARQDAARTVLPLKVFDKYVYTFTKAGEESGVEKAPDNEGFFTLEIGSYTVAVQAYIGNTGSYTLAASGTSSEFIVASSSNDTIEVRLSGVAAVGEGKFTYTITMPANATAEITLQKWPDMNDITLSPINISQGNGKTQTLQLGTGSYLLTVLVSKDDLYAGIIEIVYIYPALSTVYTKVFNDNDLLTPAPITNAEIIVTAPVKGAAPITTATGTGNFTIGTVSWSPENNPFLGNTLYTATVTLTANSRCTFKELNTATVNGQTAEVSNNTGKAVTLSYRFPATDEKTVTGMAIKMQPAKLDDYTHGETLDLTGLVVTLTYDDTTKEDVIAANFTAKNITANPSDGNKLVRSTHNGKPVMITYGDLTANTNNLTVNKATGKEVAPPTLNTRTSNSITINPVTAPSTGQTIEYAINTSNTAPQTGWQSGTMFNGLTQGTTYYIFARSAENSNYYTGMVSESLEVMTVAVYTVTFESNGGSSVTTQTVNSGGKAICPANPTRSGYTFLGWYRDNETFANGWDFDTDTVGSDLSLYAKWQPNLTGTVKITGSLLWAGQSLSADTSSLNGTGAINYQWQRDGGKIDGAIGATYTITVTDVGREISVMVSRADCYGTITSAAVIVIVEPGTATNPFKVETVADLQRVGKPTSNGGKYDNWALDKHYIQTAPINMTGQSFTAIGTFTGSYDGNRYTITGLTINASPDNQGMFRIISTTGTVSNVALLDVKITGGTVVGGVAGVNSGTVQNCSVSGNITRSGDIVGGVAGWNSGTVQNCSVSGNINGNYDVGGVAGLNDGTVQNCYATGSVSSKDYVGGVVGMNRGTVQNCVALNSSVKATDSAPDIGRVVGYIDGGTLINNYARSTLTPTTSSTATGKGGANVSAGTGTNQYNNQNFWESPSRMGWPFGISTSSPWQWNSTTNLPKLWFE